MISPDLALGGALLPLAGFASCAWAVLAGRARPSLISWSLWAAAPLIAFAAEIAQHVSLRAALVTGVLGAGPLLVVVATLTRRETRWRVTLADAAWVVAWMVALELWAVTRQGNVAIGFAILADGLAAVPTIRKSRARPESESPWTYLASGAGAVITLAVIPRWTFAACAFPVYAAGVCALISALILIPRLRPLPEGRQAAAAALRRGGWAAGTAGCLAAIAVAGLGITGTLAAPGRPAPAAAAAMTRARPAHTIAAPRRPGASRHHRHRRRPARSAQLAKENNHAHTACRPGCGSAHAAGARACRLSSACHLLLLRHRGEQLQFHRVPQ